jgi:hypothetical protein
MYISNKIKPNAPGILVSKDGLKRIISPPAICRDECASLGKEIAREGNGAAGGCVSTAGG